MAFTFNPDNPTDRDRVRVLIGDITDEGHKISDSLINMVLTQEGSVSRTAIRLARLVAQDYTRRASVSLGPLSADYGAQAQFYMDLADTIERDARRNAGFAAIPSAGGLATEDDPMMFGRGMHDNTQDVPAVGEAGAT